MPLGFSFGVNLGLHGVEDAGVVEDHRQGAKQRARSAPLPGLLVELLNGFECAPV